MKIVSISKEKASYFKAVAPQSVLGLLSFPGFGALGAIEDRGCVGIIVFSKKSDDYLTIEWLYVDEEYRGEGFGALLIEKVFSVGKSLGAKYVRARIPYDEVFEDMQLYLLEWGFNWVKTIPGEIEITVKNLYKTSFAKKAVVMREGIPSVQTLSGISNKDFAEGIKSLKEDGKPLLFDIEKNREYLDPDISTVSSVKGKINGMILFKREENIIYPVATWVKNSDMRIATNLFATVLKNGVKHIGADDIIKFYAGTENDFFFMKRVIPEIEETSIYVMQAPIDAIDKLYEEDVDTSLDGAFAMKDAFMPEDIPGSGYSVVEVEVR